VRSVTFPGRLTVGAQVRSHRPLLIVGLTGAAYFFGLAVALHLEWYPNNLPGYIYIGVIATAGAATTGRWPLETLSIVTAYTAVTALGPLPPEVFGLYVSPPESLVPLAVVTFLTISGRGPVFAPAATFLSLAVLVILPLGDIVAVLIGDMPLGQALLLDSGLDRSILLAELVAAGLVVLVAVLLRRQRRATAQLAITNRELSELRAAEVARIAERERTRIAREVHDEVGHHVAALVIRAQTAIRLSDQHPEQLGQAVREIAEGGQDILARIRAVVRVLKPALTDSTASREPFLAEDLATLLDRIRSVGYTIDSDITPDDDMPAAHRSALLNVVQESLTNVMLHSAARHVRVDIDETLNAWSVTVVDPGPARERFPEVPAGGSGILAMRDSIARLGGTLNAGKRKEDSGWTVHAEVPRTSPTTRETVL
jgi:signal transduction histidine kinase